MRKGGSWLLEDAGRVRRLHAREAVRRASADGADDRRVRRHRGAAAARAASRRRTGSSRGALIRRVRRARPARHRRARGVRRARSRQGLVARRRRAHRARRRRLRRRSAARPICASCRSCCSAPTQQKEQYLPRLVSGRAGRRLRAQRVGLGLRRAGGEDARHRAADGSWRAQRREDVDHQRRLRRRDHRLRQGRRRAVHRVHRREGRSRA